MLHDPRKELPGGEGFAILDFLELFCRKAHHAWTHSGQVVWWFNWKCHNLSKFVFNDLVKVNEAPSIVIVQMSSLAADSSTMGTNHQHSEVIGHGWLAKEIVTR